MIDDTFNSNLSDENYTSTAPREHEKPKEKVEEKKVEEIIVCDSVNLEQIKLSNGLDMIREDTRENIKTGNSLPPSAHHSMIDDESNTSHMTREEHSKQYRE